MRFSQGVIQSLETRPHLWRTAQWVRYRNSRLIGQLISPDHHVVLEGFPRSGNSFAVRSFLYANGARRTWSIAHHFHRLPQVSLAVAWQRPTVVFVRQPYDAVLSLVALAIQSGLYRLDAPNTCRDALTRGFKRWHFYYENVLEMHEHLILSDFSATTGAFDKVTTALNQKFDRDFLATSPDDSAATSEIFRTGGTHLSPDSERDHIKSRLAAMLHSAEFDAAKDETARLYDRVRLKCIVAD